MTQDQGINSGIQALRHEVVELRREVAELKLETTERLTKMEVGVSVMRWMFSIFLAFMALSITAASVILGYIQGG